MKRQHTLLGSGPSVVEALEGGEALAHAAEVALVGELGDELVRAPEDTVHLLQIVVLVVAIVVVCGGVTLVILRDDDGSVGVDSCSALRALEGDFLDGVVLSLAVM